MSNNKAARLTHLITQSGSEYIVDEEAHTLTRVPTEGASLRQDAKPIIMKSHKPFTVGEPARFMVTGLNPHAAFTLRITTPITHIQHLNT